METEQRLSLDDLGESWAALMLLDLPLGAVYLVGLRDEGTRERVQYAEQNDLEAARATAAGWRAEGHQVAIWQRVE